MYNMDFFVLIIRIDYSPSFKVIAPQGLLLYCCLLHITLAHLPFFVDIYFWNDHNSRVSVSFYIIFSLYWFVYWRQLADNRIFFIFLQFYCMYEWSQNVDIKMSWLIFIFKACVYECVCVSVKQKVCKLSHWLQITKG